MPTIARPLKQTVPARDTKLNRANPGQLRDAIKVGVEEDTRVTNKSNRHIALVHFSPLFGPYVVSTAEVSRYQLKLAHLPLPQGSEQNKKDQYCERHGTPRLVGDITFRHRLRDTRTIRCCEAPTGMEARRQSLVAGFGGEFRTGSR
jgi:hypothetical protein